MATNATLFGNGGSSQSAANKTLSFTTPFNTDQVTDAVTDNNFWAKVTCNPVEIKTASVAVYRSDNYSLTFNFNSSVAINKLLSIDIYLVGYPSHIYSYSIIGMKLYAPDDGYIPSGSTGFDLLCLPWTNSGSYHTLTAVTNDPNYTVTYTTGGYRVIVSAPSGQSYTFINSRSYMYATIRYI